MPDLDTELAALRHRMRDTIDQPDLTDIAARARARTTRRRMQWSAVAAVLVVAATVPLLRGAVAPDAPVADRPDSPVISGNPHLNGIEFVTPERGYAIESNCATSSGSWITSADTYAATSDCRYNLLATTDGGRSWTAHPLPPTADGKIYTRLHSMDVLDENTVMIDRTTPDNRNERILSVDGGRTFSVVAEPIVAGPSVSVAGVLVSGCPPILGDVEMRCATVATILPDGRTSLLANQPPLTYPDPGYYPTTEGTWWVSGRDPATSELALAVSRDAGRTWTTRPLGLPVGDAWRGYVSVAEHDGTLHAVVVEADTTPASRLSAMFTSTDGGIGWTRTRTYAYDEVPRSSAGSLMVTPSGDLLVNSLLDDRKTYVTSDGGVTFTEADRSFAGIVYRVRAGYVEVPWRRVKTDHAFSVDGVEWRPFTVG